MFAEWTDSFHRNNFFRQMANLINIKYSFPWIISFSTLYSFVYVTFVYLLLYDEKLWPILINLIYEYMTLSLYKCIYLLYWSKLFLIAIYNNFFIMKQTKIKPFIIKSRAFQGLNVNQLKILAGQTFQNLSI